MSNVEINACVYSVVSIAPDDVERITKAYLYSHTVVETGFDLPSICNTKVTAVVLKTTATTVATIEPGDDSVGQNGGPAYKAATEAARLAQYQVDRFASGLYAGRVCGSKDDAIEYVGSIALR